MSRRRLGAHHLVERLQPRAHRDGGRLSAQGCKVVAIVSLRHSEATATRHPGGARLQDVRDLVLDTGAPVGDAMVTIDGLDTPVSPGSTIGGCMLVNAIKAEVADRLTRAGQPPKVLTAAAVVGADRATALFESAYDEHARRLAKLYEGLGLPGEATGPKPQASGPKS